MSDTHNPVNEYENNLPTYRAFTETVESIIRDIINRRQINFLGISSRTKTASSLKYKIKRKEYDNPLQDITDKVGVRVITYIKGEAYQVASALEEEFTVYQNESLDKSSELDVDRFGYRSLHYICDIGERRSELGEYSPFSDMKFEVQVRTILQHAWAEIEHDRNYKFPGVLPSDIRRKFYRLSAVLELVDNEFDNLAESVRKYREEVAEKTRENNLDIDINSSSLIGYLENRGIDLPYSDIYERNKIEKVIGELTRFGITSISELDRMMSDERVQKILMYNTGDTTYTGFIRDVMMMEDVDYYFREAWEGNWLALTGSTAEMLLKEYSEGKVDELKSTYGLRMR